MSYRLRRMIINGSKITNLWDIIAGWMHLRSVKVEGSGFSGRFWRFVKPRTSRTTNFVFPSSEVFLLCLFEVQIFRQIFKWAQLLAQRCCQAVKDREGAVCMHSKLRHTVPIENGVEDVEDSTIIRLFKYTFETRNGTLRKTIRTLPWSSS